MKPSISYEDFSKLELRIGRVLEAEPVEGSSKLLRLVVDLGEAQDADESETKHTQRQILAGLAGYYDPATLVGKQIVLLVNLESKVMAGLESQGMLLAADEGGRPVLLQPEDGVGEGAEVR